ncbi:MAG: CBS domain-containing protein [Candidatus Methanoperedens sp.]|nr:CBS domain-containing protein [Candidatus Methanoperedens sp.]MCZ7396734.1 CBS domain-containing protein [Candidatus Methanoperedens sp.]
MKIKDIMKEPLSVHKSDKISHAMQLMDKHDTRRLLVINGSELLGVITVRSIASKLGTWKTSNLPASSLHVAAATTDMFRKVLPDTSIEDAIALMDRTGGILVVSDNSNILGWVTPHEILKTAKAVKGYAAEIMKEPISVSPADRVSHARRIMLDNDIGRLPVIENVDVVGIVTEKDVARAMMNFRALVPDNQQDGRIRNLIVEDIMTRNVKSVRTNTPISEVISLMLNENIGGVPVLNLKDEIVGVISRRGIIRHLAVMTPSKKG